MYAIAGGGAGNVPSYDVSDKVSPTSAPISIAAGYGSPNGSDGYVRYHTHTGQPNDPIPRRVPAHAEHPGFYPGDKVHLFLIEDIPYELTNRYFDKRLKEKDNYLRQSPATCVS